MIVVYQNSTFEDEVSPLLAVPCTFATIQNKTGEPEVRNEAEVGPNLYEDYFLVRLDLNEKNREFMESVVHKLDSVHDWGRRDSVQLENTGQG